jgi:hypothetical protein
MRLLYLFAGAEMTIATACMCKPRPTVTISALLDFLPKQGRQHDDSS